MILDALFMLILVVSIICGIVSGFSKTLLNFTILIGSGYACDYFLPDVKASWNQESVNTLIILAILYVVAYLLCLVIGFLLVNLIYQGIRRSSLRGIDQFLGGIWGVIRVGIITILIGTVMVISDVNIEQYDQLSQSRIMRSIYFSLKCREQRIKDSVQDIKSGIIKKYQKGIQAFEGNLNDIARNIQNPSADSLQLNQVEQFEGNLNDIVRNIQNPSADSLQLNQVEQVETDNIRWF